MPDDRKNPAVERGVAINADVVNADRVRLSVLDEDPTDTVSGDVWRTAAGLRVNIDGELGTVTVVLDS